MTAVALITGSGRGIGAATARLLAKRHHAVCINYRHDHARAEAVAADIRAEGGEACCVQADIADEDAVARLFDICTSRLGIPTALVNNAGMLERQSRLENIGRARLERVFATNVFGAIACARQAIACMSTRRGGAGGAIVNVSSRAAILGSAGEYVDYAASKAALDTFTVGLAHEVAEDGIRVNGVRPGFIDTEMHASGGESDRIERVKHTVPMKRAGSANEVANAIAWLLSEEAAYVTGTLLDVSGGR